MISIYLEIPVFANDRKNRSLLFLALKYSFFPNTKLLQANSEIKQNETSKENTVENNRVIWPIKCCFCYLKDCSYNYSDCIFSKENTIVLYIH